MKNKDSKKTADINFEDEKLKSEIVIEKTNASLAWIEKVLSMIDKYPFYKIIKALFIIVITSYVLYMAFNPTLAYEMYAEWKDETHNELIQTRLKNSPIIQEKCEELMNKVDAERCLFLELHNNTGNIVGMPFYYATSSCEALRNGVVPVAQEFNEIKLSLYPFSNFLFNKSYWHGNVEKMNLIDKSLYYKMMSMNAKYASFCVVEGTDKPCGVLYISFSDIHGEQDKDIDEVIETEIRKTAAQLGALVEATKHDKKSKIKSLF